jgi:carboxyl-terminal processing protease
MHMPRRSRGIAVPLGTIVALLLGAGFVLGATAGRESVYKYLNVFAEVYSLVRSNYVDPVEESVLLDGACRGVVGGLDPFSAYLPKEEFQALQRDPVGGPAETGLEVLRATGGVVIVGVQPGSSAARAGLRPGDQLWTIEGTPSRQLSLLQVRRAQRGAPDSVAHFLVYHPKSQKREEVRLTRALPTSPALESRVIDGTIGYLRIESAERVEKEQLKTALVAMKKEGAAQLLLDLRDSAGGSIDEAVRIAGLLMPPGTVVTIQERGGAKTSRTSTGSPAWTLPVTVLTNNGTAGAAEIVAAALRSRLKSRILGETSYGLGVSQDFVPLPSGDGLLLSVARLASPTGETWSKGIKPDQEIASTPEERAGLEPDRQLEKAIATLRPAPAAKAA